MSADSQSVVIATVSREFPTSSVIVVLAEPDVHVMGKYATELENVDAALKMLTQYRKSIEDE